MIEIYVNGRKYIEDSSTFVISHIHEMIKISSHNKLKFKDITKIKIDLDSETSIMHVTIELNYREHTQIIEKTLPVFDNIIQLPYLRIELMLWLTHIKQFKN